MEKLSSFDDIPPAEIRARVMENLAHAATAGVSNINLILMLKQVLEMEQATGQQSPQHAMELKMYDTIVEYHGLLLTLLVILDSAGIVTIEQLYHAIPEDVREKYKTLLYKTPEAYRTIADALVQPQIQL